jgi:hypothetical protein
VLKECCPSVDDTCLHNGETQMFDAQEFLEPGQSQLVTEDGECALADNSQKLDIAAGVELSVHTATCPPNGGGTTQWSWSGALFHANVSGRDNEWCLALSIPPPASEDAMPPPPPPGNVADELYLQNCDSAMGQWWQIGQSASPPPATAPGSSKCMAPSLKCGHFDSSGAPATTGVVSQFCVGFVGDTPYCYGKNAGCTWGPSGSGSDCQTDADCEKYGTDSPKHPAGGLKSPFSTGCPIISGGPKWAPAACGCA